MYRAIAWKIQQANLGPEDSIPIESLLSCTSIQLKADHDSFSIWVDDQPVRQEDLRTPAISQLASAIAVLPIVREWLLPVQQEVGKAGGVVAEGRDMGTRVFPDADIKFFLEADVNVRASRRHQELAGNGQVVPLESVRDEMVMRDHRDCTRALDPLRPALQAIMIETSSQSVDDVVKQMMGLIADRL